MDFQKDLYKLFYNSWAKCNSYTFSQNLRMIIRPICNITIVNRAHGDFIINRIDHGAALIFMFHVIYIM